ncbi:NUDIX domain-containing protein [Bacillus sp. NEB1478]|uniref:NUDIX domain-containing protein n=1 Tax=Bacillus sp. NEB1478 TaxID=3073816 RepID=UPI0028737A78|nr:NUDIX domain-containing protein [Bacillus sp. NEB1478]WNB90861.1 NUDIX domain-containing protein [Bacillus sp. NEB1478]
MDKSRPRAFAAILKDDTILMVREVNKTNDFWTLPGGGLEFGETFEKAVVREVREEVNLDVKVVKYLFSRNYEHGIEKCYLVEVTEDDREPSLGFDPEFPLNEQNLSEVKWQSIKNMKNDLHVSEVIRAMNIKMN